MQIKKDKISNEKDLALDIDDKEKLNCLNRCSRKYFNLNLLMYTIEYQQGLFNKLTKDSNLNEKDSLLSNDQIEKLLLNINHLQESAIKKFEEFNKNLDGNQH